MTGLDIKSTYTQMSYLISQLEEKKSERRIKLAIRDKLINSNYNSQDVVIDQVIIQN